MDFIVDLPSSNGRTNLVVITDRLKKGVILKVLQTITADNIARAFLQTFYRHHRLPSVIVSDKGP